MRQFDTSLQEVKQLLLDMGEKLEVAIDKAVKSLERLDADMARDVLNNDSTIDSMEDQLDEKVSALIATQQPVAKDLRKLIAALKIGSDMERMADLACNIAQVTIHLVENNLKLFKDLEDIPKMARITQKMVHDGINSYIDGNIDLSKDLAETDDKVDQMYEAIVKELLEYMIHQQQFIEVALRLSFVARYLERIADHATNIAESIVYIETGKTVDLNWKKEATGFLSVASFFIRFDVMAHFFGFGVGVGIPWSPYCSSIYSRISIKDFPSFFMATASRAILMHMPQVAPIRSQATFPSSPLSLIKQWALCLCPEEPHPQ